MRYTQQHVQNTRRSILAAASREFRAHGPAASLAGVMRAEGLTHGGFYRHFSGKQALLVEAVDHALTTAADHMLSLAADLAPAQGLARIITFYLSPEHLAHPASGCPVAALAADLAREPEPVRVAIAASLQRYRQRLAAIMPGDSPTERQARFDILFPAMAGCLMAARLEPNPARQNAQLASARAFFLQNFVPHLAPAAPEHS